MKATEKNAPAFEGQFTDSATTVEEVMALLIQTLKQPVQCIEVSIDNYVINYLEQVTTDYSFHGTFGNYSIRLNDDLNSYLDILELEEGEPDNPLFSYSRREACYQYYLQLGCIGNHYTPMKLAFTDGLIRRLTKWGKAHNMTIQEAINHCMSHWIILNQQLQEKRKEIRQKTDKIAELGRKVPEELN